MATNQNLNNDEVKENRTAAKKDTEALKKAEEKPAVKRTSTKTAAARTAVKKETEETKSSPVTKTARTVKKATEDEPVKKTTRTRTVKSAVAESVETEKTAAVKKTTRTVKKSSETEEPAAVKRTAVRRTSETAPKSAVAAAAVKKVVAEGGVDATPVRKAVSKSAVASVAVKKVAAEGSVDASSVKKVVPKPAVAATTVKKAVAENTGSTDVEKSTVEKSVPEVGILNGGSVGIVKESAHEKVPAMDAEKMSEGRGESKKIEESNSDYQALEKMMQNSDLRKKSEDSYASYKEKKSKKKFILVPILFLALLGAGIIGGVKYLGSRGPAVEKPSSIEDRIAYAEKLIVEGDYAGALDVLSGLEVSGNDEKSMELRGRINRTVNSVLKNASDNGKENEVFEKLDSLFENGDIEKTLVLLGTFETDGLKDSEEMKKKILSYEKKSVDKAMEKGDAQSVMDAAKKLIEDGSSVSAAEILSLMDVKGNDTKSRMIRNQLYSLKKDAVEKAIEDGNADRLFDSAKRMIEKGDGIKALELLSVAEKEGNDPESLRIKDRLLDLKKEASEAVISSGKKDELIGTARQMISDGDYESALEFLSSVNPDGDDSESKALRNELKTLKKDVVERASAEGRLDNVFDTADKLNENGQYTDALELLNMINVSGNSKEAKALREEINSKKSNVVGKAIENGKTDEIVDGIKQFIEDGDYSGALELLGAVKIKGDDKASKELDRQIKSLTKETVEKAVKDGLGDEVLDTAEKFIRNDDYESAENILNYLGSLGDSPEAKKMQEKTQRMMNRLKTLEMSDSMSDDEKIALAEKLIKEGRIEEALTLLNSMDGDGALKGRLDGLKKQAVEEGKSRGIDSGLLGFDENGNPILSKDEIAKKQEEDRLLKEAADRKSEEEKFEQELQRKYEEKLEKERKLQRASEEKKAREEEKKKAEYEKKLKEEYERKLKEESDRKAAAEKKLKEENDRKAAAEKKQREEAERKAAEEKRLLEEALKKAEEEKRLIEEEAKKALEEKENEIIAAENDSKLKEEAEMLRHEQNRNEIDEAIARGKKFLEAGDVESAMKEFALAESLLAEEDEIFSGDRFSSIAQSLYDAAEKATGPVKQKLKDAAVRSANSAVSKNCEKPESYFIAGMDALDKKKLAEAESLLKKAIEKNPTNYLYYYQLGRVLAMQKKNKEALKNFARCIELNDRFAPAIYNSGYVSEQLGKNKDALDFYVRATEVNPNHENAFIGQGHMLMELSQISKAKEAFQKALNLNQKRSQIYQELGACYAAEKDYNSAEGYFKKALACPDATKEKNAITYYNLSSVMYDQNKKAESMDYAKKAYENREKTDSATKANIIYILGLLTQESGNDGLAVQLYKEVLAVSPKHVKANTNLGVLLLKKDDAANAVIALTLAYEVEPNNFEVNNNLGSAYRSISRFDKSAVHYKKALSIKPNDLTVMQNLARSYASSKDYKKARSIYEGLIKKEPKKLDHLLELSRVCIFDGDPVSAEGYLAFLQASAPDFHKAEVEAMLEELK